MVPVGVFVGFAILVALSNRPALTPDGIPAVLSAQQYEQYSDENLKLVRPILEKFNQGEPISDDDKKSLEKAAQKYEAMNLYQPTAVEPHFLLAKVYQILEKNDRAEERIQQALVNADMVLQQAKQQNNQNRIDATNLTIAECQFVFSQLLALRGEYTEALNQIDAALKVAANSPDYLAQRASIYVQLEKIPEAVADLRDALALQPNHRRSIAIGKLIDSALFPENGAGQPKETP